MSALAVSKAHKLRGRLRMPGDKSISHRALLLSALAPGTSTIRGLSGGEDVVRTLSAIQALGAQVDGERVRGGQLHQPHRAIEAGNSGTTMRLLAGLCAGFPWQVTIDGDASLRTRPMDRIAEPLARMGARVSGGGDRCLPPITVAGGALRGIEYHSPVASAQVKGAVLLAGLHAEGETVVHETVRTRAHTEEMLAACGCDIAVSDDGASIRVRPSTCHPHAWDIPGDPSQAAFWIVAACLVPGSDLLVEHVYLGPGRGAFLDVLRRMGADVTVTADDGGVGDVRARASTLHATTVSGDEVPGLIDEIPVLAVAAAFAEGTTVIAEARELRVKETDRIATVTEGLIALGASVEAAADGFSISGPSALTGAKVDSHGDHRVAMAMAVAGLAAEGETVVDGWEAVVTSYPGFEDDLRSCVS